MNCLDAAAAWADKATPELRARSEMVFLKDTRPGAEGESGHVVVRQGERVFDPTTNTSYASMETYKKAQPQYTEAGGVSATHLKRILDASPGSPERANALEKARVSPELQKMMVADPEKASPEDTARTDLEALRLDAPDKRYSEKFDGLKEKLLANKDPAYQKELLRLAQPWIQNNISDLSGRYDPARHRARQFAELASGLPDDLQKSLAKSVAAGIKGGSVPNVDLAKTGKFDLHLLQALGPTQGEGMARELTQQMKTMRERFSAAKEAVEGLNKQLAALTVGFGGAMTAEQRTEAINAFKKRHEQEYGEFESAAQGLSNAVAIAGDIAKPGDYVPGEVSESTHLKEEARNVVKELGAFVNTDAGQKLIDDAVKKQRIGEPSFLDDLSEVLDDQKTLKEFGKDILGDINKGLTYALSKSLGAQALSDAMSGRTVDTSVALKTFRDGLEKNAALFGIDPEEDLPSVQKAFDSLLEGEDGAIEKFQTTLKDLELQPAGAVGLAGSGAPLRGLAVVASLIGAAKDGTGIAKSLSEKDGPRIDKSKLTGQITKLLGDGTSLSGDGGVLAIDILRAATGRDKMWGGAQRVFKTLGPVGGLIGAVGDAIGAAHAAKDGNKLEFASKSMSSLGGGLLAVSALSGAVPVAGQVIGGLLFAAGTGLNIYSAIRDDRVKGEDTKAFLEAAGMPPKLAEKIGDPKKAAKVGQFLSQLAARRDLSPEALQEKLSQLNDIQVETLVKAAEHTEMDQNGFVDSDKDDGAYLDSDGNSIPKERGDPRAIKDKLGSMDDAINYLCLNAVIVETDLAGNPRTKLYPAVNVPTYLTQ
ncbi:hypothetical protein QEG98_01095 [Myxococcus sp. MxC21-1]|uniref:hypothetical protein n=1 Tax=Myxococcus sp. MxC21-1 TaxID=3041439 RepID=UPI0029300CAC|nr:hypothetical protein [Myxococcus sp. MxC21-1]WNZ62478.1 hypothetical protein QEG98_01095 [Myxococcus sp. MxC21-1]